MTERWKLGTVPGSAAGWVAAVLFERSGSWAMGFYACVVMSLVAAGIAVGLRGARQAVLAREAPGPGAVLAK